MDIGNNIKKLRELKNISQSYMAEKLETSQKTYSNLEHAGNKIEIETIEKISKILNVSFTKILELNTEVIFNNTNQEGGTNHQNNKADYHHSYSEAELYERLLKSKEELIFSLKEEIIMLKGNKK